ncbi:MAG: hypothetical protein AAF587_00250 [Bacteroidota bacterium]
MSQRPVIFLAFANDHQDYLYKLTEEQDAIRTVLDKAVEQGLCEVHYETDTDLNKIWKVFDRYKDRISIFHYGGHAEDYSLLLKKASGERQIGHAEGLVSFLGQQKGLKLVFINGCCSKRQAEELRDKGVPAVIGTARPVDDSMATELSGKLYESLAEGRSLEQAWLGARNYVHAQRGNSGYNSRQSVFVREKKAEISDFPWDLYLRPGAEHVKTWNLAREARNPLFNLPLPESYFLRLRNSPFVGLHFFQEEDSALFFGRGAQIRELYNHLKGIHPIILLYGRSGVGKSSMLDAGLLPRTKGEYQSVYARRIQEKGLLGTLELALDKVLNEGETSPTNSPIQEDSLLADSKEQDNRMAELQQLLQAAAEKSEDLDIQQDIERMLNRLHLSTQTTQTSTQDTQPQLATILLTSMLKRWQAVEQQAGKALVIILDQVEETFTRPMPTSGTAIEDELILFLTAILPLFKGENTGIKGKLILSYRKEYHPEIRDAFRNLSLPYAELFLKRLGRKGIIEAIRGVNQHAITRKKYQLQIEDNLPEVIADDLMEDKESPIAPVLQIILEKLWKTASNDKDVFVPFTTQAYQELRKEGTTMDEFFQQQMDKLKDKRPEDVASGLALDVLHKHTTNLGTAGSRQRSELLDQYELDRQTLTELIQELEDLSLLVRIDQREYQQGDQADSNYTTILAHDTLAPIVIRAYNISDAPGQRAARILNNKLADIGYRMSESYVERLLAAKELQNTASTGGNTDKSKEELEQEYIGAANFLAMVRPFLPDDPKGELEQDILATAHVNLRPGSEEVFLAESDLAVVEKGAGLETGSQAGMPKLSSAGQSMLKLSWQKRAERIAREQAIRRRQRAFTAAISVALLIATGLGIWAWRSKIQADQKTKEAICAALTAKSRQIYEQDPTIAINLVMAAHAQFPSQETQSAIHDLSEDAMRKYYLRSYSFGDSSEAVPKAFSADGKYILTTQDTTAKLWDLSGREIQTFVGHRASILSAAFSPDGGHILTGSMDTTARLWDLNGREIQTFAGHSGSISSVAFSPNGKYILTGSEDRMVKLWDLRGKEIQTFEGHYRPVLYVSFSPDGKDILTGGKLFKLWDLSGKEIQTLNIRGNVSAIAFSPDGKHIFVGSGEKTAKLYDLIGNEIQTFVGHSKRILSVAFSPDGNHILTGSEDRMVKLWDLGGNEVQTFAGHTELVGSVAFSSDGQHILTGSEDQTVKLWDLDRQEIQTFAGHTSLVPSVAFSPDGQQVITGSWDHTAKLWDLSGQEIQTFAGHTDIVSSVAFSPDGQHILTGSQDRTARLWDLGGQEIQTFVGDSSEVYSVAFSPDGQRILTGRGDHTAKLWDLNGQEIQTFAGHSRFVLSVAFSSDGQRILTGSGDNTAKLWDLNGQEIQTFIGHNRFVRSVAFSPDGQLILTGSEDETAKLWDLGGREIQTFAGHSMAVLSVAFSPDGQQILTGSWDQRTKLWDLNGQEIQSFADLSLVRSVAFSPDGQRILTGGDDETAKLWETIYQQWEQGKIYKLSEEEQVAYGIDWAY